jgi:uncharacterized membrane protein
MARGLEIRAQIDAETTRGLIQINGGGAVAILALLPSILNQPAWGAMAMPLLIAVLFFAFGLVFAVVHNQLRRQCSLHHEIHRYRPPKGSIFGYKLKRPTICFASRACMWASVLTFVIAILVTSVGVYIAADSEKISETPMAPAHAVEGNR